MATRHEVTSVTSTTGGSLGHPDSEDSFGEHHNLQPRRDGHATVLLNGLQLLRCPLPPPGAVERITVNALDDLNVTEERGGYSLDVLFLASHDPAPGRCWSARLTWAAEQPASASSSSSSAAPAEAAPAAAEEQGEHLGSVTKAQQSSHFGYYVKGTPKTFTLEVSHCPATSALARCPAEERLVEEVRAMLKNPRLNRGGGSLSSILLNNKAKESVLLERVLRNHGGSWAEFLRAHRDVFTVFSYTEQEIKANNLAPHIKRSDARVYLTGESLHRINEVDKMRADQHRKQEEDLKGLLLRLLDNGPLSQKDLLRRMKTEPCFNDSLYPSQSLLMRFLSRHADLFVWASGPDQPTRVGLASPGRSPRHETASSFLLTNHSPHSSSSPDRAASRSAISPLSVAGKATYLGKPTAAKHNQLPLVTKTLPRSPPPASALAATCPARGPVFRFDPYSETSAYHFVRPTIVC